MKLNRIPASNNRKNEKSRFLLDQRTQPQLFQVSTGQPEGHWYTTMYEISDKRRDSTNRRTQYEEPIGSGPESAHELQQRRDYLQQSPLQDLLHGSHMPQEQLTSEEFAASCTVRKLHMRQREFMTQPQLPNTSFPVIGQHQGHLVNYGAFVQETPKPQRERKEKRKTIQSNARNTLAEPLEEISYIPRD